MQGQGTFIFQILRASWKSTTEPNVYVLPVTASPQLIRMFIVGMKFREPAAETQTTTWIQFGATLDGTYLALIDMHERCRTNEDVKKLVVPSVDLILAVANTLNNKAGNAGEQVVLEGYKALIDAVQAWNDPQALVNSLPQKYKPWLANAAARALRVVQASSALASRIGQEHYDAIVALVAYCKGNITTTQSQRK